MPVDAAKRRLREEMQRWRRAVSPRDRERMGDAVARRVLASPHFAAAARVALYAALADEVPTERLLRAVLDAGRPLLLPRAEPDGRLAFARVADLVALERGRFGALEPPSDAPAEQLGRGDLVLVPGVAFDRRGGRLGRGGGFYDRSLPGDRDAPLVVGLAYSFQLLEAVPLAAHDRRVDAVVTEAELCCARAEDPRELPSDSG